MVSRQPAEGSVAQDAGLIDAGLIDAGGFGALGVVDDAELAALALAADPDVDVPDDAVPFGVDGRPAGLLPEWYMPAPAGLRRSRSTRLAVGAIVVSLALVNAVGLCVTYGLPEIAW